MKVKINVFIIVLILTIFELGCNRSNVEPYKAKKAKSIDIECYREEYVLLNPKLRQVIIGYINEVDGSFFDKEWLYYSLFFFHDGGKFYFTIWTFTCYPKPRLTHEYKNQEYTNVLYSVNDRKVVFIFPNSMSSEGLFISTPQSENNAKVEYTNPCSGPIYDGDWYFKTFEITQFEGQWNFNKIERANVVFLKLQPPANYLH